MLPVLVAYQIVDLWYALPLVVAVSLVYSATRNERMEPILAGAARFAIWVLGFLAVTFAILYFLSWNL
jgi:hypothetical protein